MTSCVLLDDIVVSSVALPGGIDLVQLNVALPRTGKANRKSPCFKVTSDRI